MPLPGLLHGRLVLSPYAHASIDRIDTSAALKVPGVVAVLTAADLGIKGFEDIRVTKIAPEMKYNLSAALAAAKKTTDE